MVLQAYAHKAASDQSISLTVRACHAGVSAAPLPIKSRRMRWSRGLKLCRAFVRDARGRRDIVSMVSTDVCGEATREGWTRKRYPAFVTWLAECERKACSKGNA